MGRAILYMQLLIHKLVANIDFKNLNKINHHGLANYVQTVSIRFPPPPPNVK